MYKLVVPVHKTRRGHVGSHAAARMGSFCIKMDASSRCCTSHIQRTAGMLSFRVHMYWLSLLHAMRPAIEFQRERDGLGCFYMNKRPSKMNNLPVKIHQSYSWQNLLPQFLLTVGFCVSHRLRNSFDTHNYLYKITNIPFYRLSMNHLWSFIYLGVFTSTSFSMLISSTHE